MLTGLVQRLEALTTTTGQGTAPLQTLPGEVADVKKQLRQFETEVIDTLKHLVDAVARLEAQAARPPWWKRWFS
jgi:hypothetical protein